MAQEIGGREGRLDICVCITERKKIGSGEYLELSEEDLDKVSLIPPNISYLLNSHGFLDHESKRQQRLVLYPGGR